MKKMKNLVKRAFLTVSKFFKIYPSIQLLIDDAKKKNVEKLLIIPYISIKESLMSKTIKRIDGFIEITAENLPAVCSIECSDAFSNYLSSEAEDEIFEDCKESLLETAEMFKKYLEEHNFKVEIKKVKIL
ncbi:MAG: hypothetical protein ACP5IX_00405 [Patescibacteria group bacterium]